MCSSVDSISCGSCSIHLQQFLLTATWTQGSTFAFPPIWVPVRSLNEFHLEGHLPVVFSLSWSTTSSVISLVINLLVLIVWGLNCECCGELLLCNNEDTLDKLCWNEHPWRVFWLAQGFGKSIIPLCCYFEASMTCCTLWFPVSWARGSGCHSCWIQT